MYAPYGLKVKHDLQEFPCELQSVDVYRGSVECLPVGEKAFLGTQNFYVEFVKPVLRPMESMTLNERRQHRYLPHYDEMSICGSTPAFKRISWLCEHKFDFLNLIPRGLAVDEKEIF